MGETRVARTKVNRYLGVTLDEKLNFGFHMKLVSGKELKAHTGQYQQMRSALHSESGHLTWRLGGELPYTGLRKKILELTDTRLCDCGEEFTPERAVMACGDTLNSRRVLQGGIQGMYVAEVLRDKELWFLDAVASIASDRARTDYIEHLGRLRARQRELDRQRDERVLDGGEVTGTRTKKNYF
uniref:Uncharacterized protein n=1 Tax=Timema tahoe TaxID=61484 RepID=A0A7R9IEQ0_9NEOP|nr:unnamed protein product [Timema tahoe]